MTNTPLNLDARRAAFEAVQAIDGPASIGSMEIVDAAVSAYLAAAHPEVNSAEDVPASLQCIAWEEEPEHGLWKITEDETFVGLIIKAGRSWSPADKYTLRIERPEVPGA